MAIGTTVGTIEGTLGLPEETRARRGGPNSIATSQVVIVDEFGEVT